MKKLLMFVVLIGFVLMFSGCAGKGGLITIDGQVDAVEQSIINLAVGGALTAMPQAIAPAYAVSTALLGQMDNESVLLADLDGTVQEKIDKLELTANEKLSAVELYNVIKAKTVNELEVKGVVDPGRKLVIIKAVIRAVKKASAARLGVVGIVERPASTLLYSYMKALDRDIDRAIARAEAETDEKLLVNEYKAKLRKLLEEGRREFEQTPEYKKFGAWYDMALISNANLAAR